MINFDIYHEYRMAVVRKDFDSVRILLGGYPELPSVFVQGQIRREYIEQHYSLLKEGLGQEEAEKLWATGLEVWKKMDRQTEKLTRKILKD